MVRINLLIRMTLGFLLFMAVTTLIAWGNNSSISTDKVYHEPNYQILETARVYRGSKITGSVSSNTSAVLTIKVLQIDGEEVVILSRRLDEENNHFIELDATVGIGGVLFLNLTSTVNTTEFKASIVDIYADLRLDLGYLLSTNKALFNSVIGIGTVSWIWERVRRRKIRLPSFYGRVQLTDITETLGPTFLAIASFSFGLPDPNNELGITSSIFSEIGRTTYFNMLYWAMILLVGHLYYSHKETEVKEQWTTFRGRERTFIFRSLYANLTIWLVLGEMFGFYLTSQYIVLYNYSFSSVELNSYFKFTLTFLVSASLHLVIFALLFLTFRYSEFTFYTVSYLTDYLLRPYLAFTTFPSSTLNRISKGYDDLWAIPWILVTASILYLVAYRIYSNLEVNR